MKPVSPRRPMFPSKFVEVSYEKYPAETLANLAQDFLHMFQSVNGKFNNPSQGRILQSKRFFGASCVIADRHTVSVDFTKAVTQGWAASEIYDAEILIDEICRREKSRGVVYSSDIDLTNRLHSEINKFVDYLCTPGALKIEDLMYSSHKVAEDLVI